MKNLLFVSSMLFASFAQAEVKPLAQSITSGGYCLPGGCPPLTITIRDDGWVSFDTAGKKKNLIFLKPELISKLKAEIAVYQKAPLKDLQEGEPFCADIPEVSYKAFKSGRSFEIARDSNCHTYRPDAELFNSEVLVQVLNSLKLIENNLSK